MVDENIGPFASSDKSTGSQSEPMDELTRGRHVWTKGRMEFMGGPTVFTQGHGVPGYENNERHMGYPPQGVYQDPMAREMGVDITEQ